MNPNYYSRTLKIVQTIVIYHEIMEIKPFTRNICKVSLQTFLTTLMSLTLGKHKNTAVSRFTLNPQTPYKPAYLLG